MSTKKKFNSLEDLGGLVYSTGNSEPVFEEEELPLNPSSQLLEAHLEKKGRGGKTAVVIKGFEGAESQLKDLAKDLKNHCASGGSVKEGNIIIQGNVRDKIMEYLKGRGYKVKRVGG